MRLIKRYPLLRPALAFILLLILMVTLRLESLLNPRAINPDEAELIAVARIASMDPAPYRSYTTGTFLFLWPTFLAILFKLGLPLNFYLTHWLAGILYCFIIFCGWLILSRYLGWVVSGFLILPAGLVVLSGVLYWENPDLLSLGTELLPISLVMLSSIVATSATFRDSSTMFVISIFILGLVPWAKPQLTPLALIFLFALVTAKVVQRHQVLSFKLKFLFFQEALIALFAFVLPTALFVLWMIGSDSLGGFVNETLKFNLRYMLDRSLVVDSSAPTFVSRAGQLGIILIGALIFFTWAYAASLMFSFEGNAPEKQRMTLAICAWSATLFSTVAVLLVSIPFFTHYINVWIGGCLLTIAVVALFLHPIDLRNRSVSRRVYVTFGALFFVIALAILPTLQATFSTLGNYSSSLGGVFSSAAAKRDRDAVHSYCPVGSRVLVWGWAADLFAHYEWMPAVRQVNFAPPNIDYSGLKTVFPEKMPQCIVEASGDGFFRLGQGATFKDAIGDYVPEFAECFETKVLSLYDDRDVTLHVRKQTCKI